MGRIRYLFILWFVFVLLFPLGKTETYDVIEALVDFMDKLEPGTSMQNTTNWGWNKSSDPCTSGWFGVKCDNNQIVKIIVLEQINLTGIVDFESVCEVTNLLLLGLKFNNLSGSLLEEISDCKRLRLLDLNGNCFSGQLPNSVTDLSNLVRIDISNNELNGKLPDMSKNTGLRSFLAQNNRFSGNLPDFNYEQLVEFDVSYNDLSGKVPDKTGRFGDESFKGNPKLCGKELPNKCKT